MPGIIKLYVRWVDRVNRFIGRFAMYFVLVMMAGFLYSTIMRMAFNVYINWMMESAQFLLSAYYLLGGGYSMQLDAHVRMDLLYSRWSPRTRACMDAITIWLVIVFLAFLLLGGISSTEYALVNDQRNYTAWAPPLAPIKIIMTFGIFMMLLQTLATFFRDLATAIGKPIE
ncbi:TRAP transporter small permease subunit [Castellaniella daejeonensis]|uniref:TRAP transporter small permease protein n=1 Tax=Castellaniella daejeonensis TaxID=659013 RepID=A0ABN0TAX9_9BURK|nr:TRAP transporter small permease subunit [Castellaniella sp.]HET8704529.1 TRAP transporter small permease subunit [Castellaniella sp.]